MAKGNPTKRCDWKPPPGCGMVGGMKTKPSDRRHEAALLRFRVVNYIADRQREGICLAQALREASTRPWPDESGNYFACRTIEDWWYVHAKGGFPALVDAPRRDNGNFRVIDAPTGQWIIEQVSQSPKIHLSVLYTHWQSLDRQLPSLRSVYRYLRRHGYDKARLRAGRLESGPTHAFEAPMPNDLWMVDFSPGPTIRENGAALSTQLCVLIDDCSRLIPFGAYYRRADTESFHHALKQAVLRRGLPKALYTDQGKPFVSHHTRIVCASLGIRLLHAKPYHAWSKGKVERLIQTIQAGFEAALLLPDQQAASLDELNDKFSKWIQTVYHQRIHSATRMSPEARFQKATQYLRRLPADVDIETLFYTRLDRTVRKDGTVRLDGQLYEAPLSLRTLTVQLRFDPFSRCRIEVWYQDKFIALAKRVNLNLNHELGGSNAYEH
jgi:transposase InsO family protein